MWFQRNRSQFGNGAREQAKQEAVDPKARVDALVSSPTKPTFDYRAPVSWPAAGYGFVRVDHSGAHEDPRLGRLCVFGGDCVEVIEFDPETASLKPNPIHVAWPYLKPMKVEELSEPIDLRAPVVELDSFRTEKVWGDMKKTLLPEPKSES